MMPEQMNFEFGTSYPQVGMIAVTAGGARIAVWPDEGDHPECFTGQLLESGASLAKARGVNLSVFWRRDRIVRIEVPTPDDCELSLTELCRDADKGRAALSDGEGR